MLYIQRHGSLLSDIFQTVGQQFFPKLQLLHQLQKLSKMEIRLMLNTIDQVRRQNSYNGEELEESDEMLLGIMYNNLYNHLDDFFYLEQFLETAKGKGKKEAETLRTLIEKEGISADEMTSILDDFKSWKKDVIEAQNKELDKILLLDIGI